MPAKDPSTSPSSTSSTATTKDSDAKLGLGNLTQRAPVVVADKTPVTKERLPAMNVGDMVPSPGVARADVAASLEKPDGDVDWAKKNAGYTPLQMHVRFWDEDDDGEIYPLDTYRGCRQLGFNVLFSLFVATLINGTLAYPTRLAYTWIPDLWFRIYVASIHKAKHGSDSATYDHEGRFVPQNFENSFAKYDKDKDGALSVQDLRGLLSGNRDAMDQFGSAAAILEWAVLWILVQKDGKIMKEDLRSLYDGSLFFRIRDARNSAAGWNQGFGLGSNGLWGLVKKKVLEWVGAMSAGRLGGVK